MSGAEIWSVMRWMMGLYLIGLGAYALVTKRMPRLRRRPYWSWPFASGHEYRDREAVVAGLICLALGFVVLMAPLR